MAAADLGCNLLLGCGLGPTAASSDPLRPAWPFPSPDADFVPIGPWNTHGLIAINPLYSEERSRDLQQVRAAGHPLQFIGSGERGPTIVADNAGGILAAMQHLVEHGHRRIAFIAGGQEDMAGDSGARLMTYRAALAQYGLAADERLVAYGRHDYDVGYSAMRQLIGSGAAFTAVLASNDESAFGAMQALAEAGLKIPQDVAIIGFDDRPECAVQEPALTSVHISLFKMGYRAVELLLQQMSEHIEPAEPVKMATRLVLRESCGCGWREPRLHGLTPSAPAVELSHTPDRPTRLARAMAEAILTEAQSSGFDTVYRRCQHFVAAFVVGVEQRDRASFQRTLDGLLREAAADGEGAHVWQAAVSLLDSELPTLFGSWEQPLTRELAHDLLDQARIAISAATLRQHQQFVVDQSWTAGRIGLLTARLLTALDETQVYQILGQHLSEMGIQTAAVALFEPEAGDPVAWSSLRAVTTAEQSVCRYRTRDYPPADLCAGDQPFSQALLPLVSPRGQLGYVAFDTTHLELYGAIAQQIAGALNTAQLYREATEGRRLAEEANQMKSRFLSTVSHELRTPLNLIVGLGGILLRDHDQGGAPLPPAARKDIERLNANAQHLGRLIGDVLDLASSDAGQLRLTNELVDLGQALRLVAETGRQLALDKGLAWHAALPMSGPWVWGDRTRLRQIALNLISNAIKFTARGEVNLIVKTGAGSVTVSVRDTGLGIPPAEQQVIFDEFRRSERSITRGYGGLGLGLAICKRLIDLHGGTIGLHSTGQEDAGSTFYFTLPTVEPPAQSQKQHAAALADQSVLVLTNRSGAGERLRDHLRQRGFEVHIALMDEPASWQSRLAVSPPSVVVLDVSVASDHGWRVLRAIKGNPATQGIPVLFYALSPDSGSVLELDYLTKPIELAELTRALDQHWLLADTKQPLRTFLVIDDDPDTLEMHARIAQTRSSATRVLKAHNGLEALEIMGRERIDLILLDLIMPEMDGFAVLEAMHEREATRDIPVIVVTGQTLTEGDMARLNLGVTKVLNKGLFSLDETLAHLDAALARKRDLSGEAQRLVRQAMAYIQEHYADPISRQDLADHVGLSDDYLTSCFHKELGLTPVAYLNRYRVQQAKQLLRDTHLSVTEIALQVGFSGSSYFSRIFHRETGMTPAVYRRM
jgi:signal transduction histidine kinase/AraC-like DNA-binding protein/ABC-type sugar transport system substrate-binding protein/DNA-binding LytR/AlgR family response regulator